jgi:NAD(P)-dependent dehydrogenase (short-subunit alcohol dehydrogenase family)
MATDGSDLARERGSEPAIFPRLDVLMNNAGVSGRIESRATVDGYERQIVEPFGHFETHPNC